MPIRRMKRNGSIMESVGCEKLIKNAQSDRFSEKQNCQSPTSSSSTIVHLQQEFFDQPCEQLARALLGKLLVRRTARILTGPVSEGIDDLDSSTTTIQMARIVETEAYPGGDDKPSHSYGGRRTARNEAMFMSPGTVNVYNIYGVLQCMNVSSRGDGAAVLIRAAEPLEGLQLMAERRTRKAHKVAITKKGLCNGPSKLCEALGITKAEFDQVDSTRSEDLFFADDSFIVNSADIIATGRIGIAAHGEYFATLPMRFYIRANDYVSVK